MPYAVLTSDGGIPSGIKAPQLAPQTAGSSLSHLTSHPTPPDNYRNSNLAGMKSGCRNTECLSQRLGMGLETPELLDIYHCLKAKL